MTSIVPAAGVMITPRGVSNTKISSIPHTPPTTPATPTPHTPPHNTMALEEEELPHESPPPPPPPSPEHTVPLVLTSAATDTSSSSDSSSDDYEPLPIKRPLLTASFETLQARLDQIAIRNIALLKRASQAHARILKSRSVHPTVDDLMQWSEEEMAMMQPPPASPQCQTPVSEDALTAVQVFFDPLTQDLCKSSSMSQGSLAALEAPASHRTATSPVWKLASQLVDSAIASALAHSVVLHAPPAPPPTR